MSKKAWGSISMILFASYIVGSLIAFDYLIDHFASKTVEGTSVYIVGLSDYKYVLDAESPVSITSHSQTPFWFESPSGEEILKSTFTMPGDNDHVGELKSPVWTVRGKYVGMVITSALPFSITAIPSPLSKAVALVVTLLYLSFGFLFVTLVEAIKVL